MAIFLIKILGSAYLIYLVPGFINNIQGGLGNRVFDDPEEEKKYRKLIDEQGPIIVAINVVGLIAVIFAAIFVWVHELL